MDVSKYRTRYPPKEHEEAVRMLLEGLDTPPLASGAPKAKRNDLKPQATRGQLSRGESGAASGRMQASGQQHRLQQPGREQPCVEVSPTSSIDSGSLAQCDDDYEDSELVARGALETNFRKGTRQASDDRELEFTSEESSSQDQIQVSPQIARSKQAQMRQQSLNKLTNKRLVEQQLEAAATAAVPRMQSKGTSTTSESLVASEGGHGGWAPSDHEEPHGDYEAIPSRTIAVQCDLKLSSVKRDGYLLTDSASSDLASMQASSISSTRYGFYKLSPETLGQRRLLSRSISSRNIAHRWQEEEQEAAEEAERAKRAARRRASVDERAGLAPSKPESPSLADEELRAIRSREGFEQQQATSRVEARIRDTLPHRPKTALSYVSTGRLRDQAGSERSLSDAEEAARDEAARPFKTSRRHGGEEPLRERTLSHQTLSAGQRPAMARADAAAPRRLADVGQASSSNSDSELGAADRFRVPCNEELLVTRRGPQVPRAAATNYTSARARANASASAAQLFRRSQTLTGGLGADLPANLAHRRPLTALNNNRDPSVDREGPLPRQSDEPRRVQKYAKFAEGTGAPTFEPAARANTRNSDDEPVRLSRYNSMSLSRTPTCRPSNLTGAQFMRRPTAGGHLAAGPSASYANEAAPTRSAADRARNLTASRPAGSLGPSASLTRRERSASQQTLQSSCCPAGGESAARIMRPKSSADSAAPLAAHIGRSTSMKQVGGSGPRLLLPAGGGGRAHPQRRSSPLGRQEPRVPPTRRLYSTDCDSSCCELEKSTATTGALDDEQLMQAPSQQQQHQQPRPRPQLLISGGIKRSESEDSESPVTRTWANPSATRVSSSAQRKKRQPIASSQGRGLGDAMAPRGAPDLGDARAPCTRKACNRVPSSYVDLDDDYEQELELELDYDEQAQAEEYRRLAGRTLHRTNPGAEHEHHTYRASQGLAQEPQCQQSEEQFEHELASAQSSLDDKQSAQADGHLLAARAAAQHQPLDFDSQQRLNELGLPDLDGQQQQQQASTLTRQRAHMAPSGATSSSSSSHLGLAGQQPIGTPAAYYATTGRRANYSDRSPGAAQQGGLSIKGRAMSQQSLTRPTMPLSRRLRRSGTASGSQSGASDAGGSSMSLASRMRYENAHTRTPVVMYIPQAIPKASSSEHLTRKSSGTLLRKSARQFASKTLASRHSSQDRTVRRSLSRQGSDSEASSSSMLRTLVKPRGSRTSGSALGRGQSGRRRAGARRDQSDEEETMDEIGQLATEIDSYKFRRRYSVPKDAKINWFSKLKQRVTSKS